MADTDGALIAIGEREPSWEEQREAMRVVQSACRMVMNAAQRGRYMTFQEACDELGQGTEQG